MIDGIRLKICGLTALVDAEFVDRAGADALGFILYPKSPRHLSLLQYKAMAPRLPAGRKRVAVMVEPSSKSCNRNRSSKLRKRSLFVGSAPDQQQERQARRCEISPPSFGYTRRRCDQDRPRGSDGVRR